MVLMIGWGTDQSRPATRKFVLFTLAGSLPMMAGLAGMATLASPNAFDLTIAISSLAKIALASGVLRCEAVDHPRPRLAGLPRR